MKILPLLFGIRTNLTIQVGMRTVLKSANMIKKAIGMTKNAKQNSSLSVRYNVFEKEDF